MTTLSTGMSHLNSSSSSHTTHSMWPNLRSPKLKFLVIECLVCTTTFLLVFLAVFGTRRRRSRSRVLKFMLWTAYNTSSFLIAFILGLMQEAPFKAKLFPIWGMFLLIVYAFPDSFSAYSLEDIEQWKRYYCQYILKLLGLAFLWVLSFNIEVDLPRQYVVINAFRVMVLQKFLMRWLSLFWASSSSMKESAKLYEVYMKHEHELCNENDVNPRNLRGYNYLVEATGSEMFDIEDVLTFTLNDMRELLQRDNVVTLEKVWSCEGRLLTSAGDPDNRLKDICLSFALLKILFLKCAGYALPMEARHKAWRLMGEGLLADGDRAFRVIEVELHLLYELVYTKFPAYSLKRFAKYRTMEFVFAVIVYVATAVYMHIHADSIGSVWLTKIWGLNLDVLGTDVLILILGLVEIVQMVMVITSEWKKAALLFNYVADKSQQNVFSEGAIKLICRSWFRKPWARTLGQYSLIESPGYDIEQSFFGKAGIMCFDLNKDGQKERKEIPLSNDVKWAVLDNLRTNGTNLENGRSCLRGNSVCGNLQGACKSEHEAVVILIWHIATSYCQHRSSVSTTIGEKNRKIANSLSNYLAYLVAFAPGLLPGPPFESEFQFRRAMKEAREAFRGCNKVVDKIQELEKLAKKQDQKIIVQGAKLGRQLIELGEEEGQDTAWKILAEFWSEMTLCAAPSGDTKAHLDKLANGGEFITHLWALLHHAGHSPTCITTML